MPKEINPKMETDKVLDVRGHICPYPLIMIKGALAKLEIGQILEVLSDYEPTVTTTIPAFCERKRYALEIQAIGDHAWRARIRKTG